MLVNEGVEDMIHHSLKCGWRISKSKVHDYGFPDAETHFEHSFPLITVMDLDVVVPPLDVKGGKDEQVG